MKRWHLVLIILLLLALVLWATERHARTVAEGKAEAATDSAEVAHLIADSLKQVEAALRERYATDTVAFHDALTRWKRLAARARGVDTLPGGVDTVEVPIEVIVAVADSTIRACEAVVATCEARVAAATARADTTAEEARHWEEAATQWKKVAKGPFFRPALEATTTLDWQPQAALNLTLGRGAFKVLGRVELGEGAETCAFQPSVEAYSCSTPWEVTGRVGVRWGF